MKIVRISSICILILIGVIVTHDQWPVFQEPLGKIEPCAASRIAIPIYPSTTMQRCIRIDNEIIYGLYLDAFSTHDSQKQIIEYYVNIPKEPLRLIEKRDTDKIFIINPTYCNHTTCIKMSFLIDIDDPPLGDTIVNISYRYMATSSSLDEAPIAEDPVLYFRDR